MFLLIKILLIWTVIFAILKLSDYVFQGSISSYLSHHNITFRYGFLAFHTTRFNSRLESTARAHVKLLAPWFALGVVSGFVGLILSIIVLSNSLIRAVTPISPTITQPTQPELLLPRARLPFWNINHERPWWFPSASWNLLLARDHHPVAFQPSDHFLSSESDQSRHSNNNFISKTAKLPKRSKSLRVSSTTRTRFSQNPYSHPFDDNSLKKYSLRYSRRLLTQFDPNSNNGYKQTSTQKQTNPSSSKYPHSSFLTPLVPGVTVPEGDIWFMIVAVLVAAIVHEAGHALAAGTQRARVEGVGAFIALALPGAYARLRGIELLSPFAQLKVYCAGAWHNVVSTAVAFAAVAALPYISSVAYSLGTGALIVSVQRNSPLYNYLSPGDIILRLGQNDVMDGGSSFRKAVDELVRSRDSVAFCVPRTVLYRSTNQTTDCCLRPSAYPHLQCFQLAGRFSGRKFCIDPAKVSSRRLCRSTRDCRKPTLLNDPDTHAHRIPVSAAFTDNSHTSNTRQECIAPVLPIGQQLIDVRVQSTSSGKTVHLFYEGYAEVLGHSVTVSSYVPRAWNQIPISLLRAVAILDLPNMAERFLQYFASISLALAVVNMAPVFFFDGQACSTLYMQLILRRPAKASRASRILVRLGTLLMLANMILVVREIARR